MRGKRKLIKERIAEILRENHAVMDVNPESIFVNRIRNLEASNLPAICVYTEGETVLGIPVKSAIWEYQINLNLAVDILIMNTDNIDDDIDTYTDAVLDVIARNFYDQDNPGSPIGSITYKSWNVDLGEDGAASHAVSRLNFDVVYYAETSEDIPAIFEVGFVDYQATVELGADKAAAQDLVDMEQD